MEGKTAVGEDSRAASRKKGRQVVVVVGGKVQAGGPTAGRSGPGLEPGKDVAAVAARSEGTGTRVN